MDGFLQTFWTETWDSGKVIILITLPSLFFIGYGSIEFNLAKVCKAKRNRVLTLWYAELSFPVRVYARFFVNYIDELRERGHLMEGGMENRIFFTAIPLGLLFLSGYLDINAQRGVDIILTRCIWIIPITIMVGAFWRFGRRLPEIDREIEEW